jgi:hypothetical protein
MAMRGGCDLNAAARPMSCNNSIVRHSALHRALIACSNRCLSSNNCTDYPHARQSMKPQPPSQERRSPPRKPRGRKSTLWDSSHTPVISDKRRHFTRLQLEVVPMLALDGVRDVEAAPPTSTACPTTATFRQYPQPPRTAPAADDSKRYDTPERRVGCAYIRTRSPPDI